MEGQYNMRSPAVKRLMKEAQELREPTEQYHAQPLEDNLFEWHFTIRGPADSDFDEGIYHGRIILPPEYPMKPPSIILLTPNGRFEVFKKICLSISGHHPESWQPSWSIRTALLAIIGFMPTHGGGAIGSLNYTPEERKVLAKRSQCWKCPTCGDVSSVLKPVTAESEKTRQEAKELATQIAFKGENKKPSEASSPAAETGSSPASDQPASVPTTTTEASGVAGVGVTPPQLPPFPWPPAAMFAGGLPQPGHPAQFWPQAFPLPGQMPQSMAPTSGPGQATSPAPFGAFARFPLPGQMSGHPMHMFPPMFPHGFPAPFGPNAFHPGVPFPQYPVPPPYPGQAGTVTTSATVSPISSPASTVAPMPGVGGVSGVQQGAESGPPSPMTAASNAAGSETVAGATAEVSAAAPPAEPRSTGASANEGGSRTSPQTEVRHRHPPPSQAAEANQNNAPRARQAGLTFREIRDGDLPWMVVLFVLGLISALIVANRIYNSHYL